MRTLPGNPDEVRAAATGLATRAAAVTDRGSQIAAVVTDTSAGWDGSAQVAFTGMAQGTRAACAALGSQLRTVSTAGHTYANRLETAQGQLRALRTREENLTQAETTARARLQTLTTAPVIGPEPVFDAGWALYGPAAGPQSDRARSTVAVQTELHRLQDERRSLTLAAEEIIRRHESERAVFVKALASANPGAGVDAFLGVTPQQREAVWKLWEDGKSVGKQVRATAGLFLAGARQARIHRFGKVLEGGRSERALVRTAAEAAEHAKKFTGGPLPALADLRKGSAGVVFAAGKTLWARANLVATVIEGSGDLLHGDPDHPGARDVATRVMGGVGAGGAATLLLAGSTLGPVGLGVAGAAVSAYGVYKLGCAAYDNREAIKGAASAVWDRTERFRDAVGQDVSKKADEVKRSFAAGVGKARDVVGGVGDTLRRGFLTPRWGW